MKYRNTENLPSAAFLHTNAFKISGTEPQGVRPEIFYAQARAGKSAAGAACGPRSEQEEKPLLFIP